MMVSSATMIITDTVIVLTSDDVNNAYKLPILSCSYIPPPSPASTCSDIKQMIFDKMHWAKYG